MQKLALAIIALFLVNLSYANLTSEDPNLSAYAEWKLKHGKSYSESEDRYREFIYRERLQEVKAHNSNPENTWLKGMNHFSAYTFEELKASYLGGAPVAQHSGEVVKVEVKEDTPIVRGSKNWATEGVMGPVKNQGNCGSCWAFTAVGVIEAAFKIKNSNSVVLSEQQLVDCDAHSSGCNGGWMTTAFEYSMSFGLTTNAAYPYTATQGSCTKIGGAYKIKSYAELKMGDCKAMISYLDRSPLSVGLLVTNEWFQYRSGVFSCPSWVNGNYGVNHGVTAVGYTDQ